MYEKYAGIITLNDVRQSFSSKIRNKARMPTLTTSIQQSTGSSSQRQEKEIKVINIKKEEVKLSLFIDNTTMNIEISKDSTKKVKANQ